jgi:hypothetical protein
MSKRVLFIFTAVILGAAGIYYRAASTHSARLQADAIVASDTAGTDVTAGLAALKSYVATHMGASVKFTLQSGYDRAAAQAQAAAPASSNSQVYADAPGACAVKSDSITQARCNEAYISSHLAPATPTPVPVPAPRLADYQYDLKAPLWTPDLTGALLAGAAAAAFAALITRQRKR